MESEFKHIHLMTLLDVSILFLSSVSVLSLVFPMFISDLGGIYLQIDLTDTFHVVFLTLLLWEGIFFLFYFIKRLGMNMGLMGYLFVILLAILAIFSEISIFLMIGFRNLGIGGGIITFACIIENIFFAIICILDQKGLFKKISKEEYFKEYRKIVRNALDDLLNVTTISTLFLVLIAIVLKVLFPDYGSFLDFIDAFLLLSVLITSSPYKPFLGEIKSISQWKYRLYQFLSFSRSIIVSILLMLFVIGLRLERLLNNTYLMNCLNRITTFDMIFLIGFMLILIMFEGILAQKWDVKTKKAREIVSLIIVLIILIRIWVIFGGSDPDSFISILSIVSLIITIFLLLLPWRFMFKILNNKLFINRSRNSLGEDFYQEIYRIMTIDGMKDELKAFRGIEEKVASLFTSSNIFRYSQYWINQLIIISIMIFALFSTIDFIRNILVKSFFPEITDLITLILKITLLVAIFFGKEKVSSYTPKCPALISSGEPSRLLKLTYSEINAPKRIIHLLIFFSLPLLTFVSSGIILALYITNLPSLYFINLLYVINTILNISCIIIIQKRLIAGFIDYEINKEYGIPEKYPPILLILPPLVVLPYYIPLLFPDILMIFMFLHTIVILGILGVYRVLSISKIIYPRDSVLYVISLGTTITLGALFTIIYVNAILGVSLILVSLLSTFLFQTSDLHNIVNNMNGNNLEKLVKNNPEKVEQYIYETIEFNTRPGSFYSGMRIIPNQP
ncbi:MAG: hypothetical protein ACTSW1_02635 [Candidatus Hodarchaeales archaeon]